MLENGTADFMFLSGIPSKELYIINLRNLYEKRAKMSILEKPPTKNHYFIYNSPKDNGFTWVKEKHKNDKARSIFYNPKPSYMDKERANEAYDLLRGKKRPYEIVIIIE